MNHLMYLESNYLLFPFHRIAPGSDVVLYGYGIVGKQYKEQITKTKYCNIKYIVDRNWERQPSEIPLRDPQILRTEKDAWIVITTPKYEDEIRALLSEMDIDDERVIFEEIRVDALAQDMVETDDKTIALLDRFRHLVSVRKAEGAELVRIGRDNDGGYLMLSDHLTGGVAYSFGISQDVSWDKAMVERGYDVFMYDHTIKGLPEANPHFHWQKMGIEGKKSDRSDLATLEELIDSNHHRDQKKMILKMDVEGAEWECLAETGSDVLAQFDQIVLELHNCLEFRKLGKIVDCLEKLDKTHQCVHVHPNNYSSRAYIDSVPYVGCIEVTFANRDYYSFIECTKALPHELDQSCHPFRMDIPFGTYYNAR